MRKFLFQTSRGTVFALFACILLWLFFLAGFSTAMLSFNGHGPHARDDFSWNPSTVFDEHTFHVEDSIWRNMLFVLDFALLIYCLGRIPFVWRFAERVNGDKAYSDKHRRIALCCAASIALTFILVTQNLPWVDQRFICEMADAWVDKDYSSLNPSGYLGMWPQLLGSVLLLYLSTYIFGAYNFLACQIWNVIALVFLLKGLAELADLSGRRRICGLCIIIAGILFLPLTLYTTFLYGNLIGLSLTVNAVKYAVRYCEDCRLPDAVKSVLLIFAAVIIKSNYLICLIGLILFVILLFMEKPSFRRLLLALVFVLLLLINLNNRTVRWATQLVTGQPVGAGMSSWAWLAMGLQDDATGRYDGWFNGYSIDSYVENKFDAAAQGRECKEYVVKRLNEFLHDPGRALWFFAGKNASTWNNPNFQSFWFIRGQHFSRVRHPRWLGYLLSEPGSSQVTVILNYYQFLVLSGVILFILLGRRRHAISFFYCVVFIGGFIFHTFWEVKAQYAFTYFVLLLPLFVEGYCDLFECIEGRRSLTKSVKIYYILSVALLLGIAVLGSVSQAPWLKALLLRDEDTEKWQQYITSRIYSRLPDGLYRLRASGDPSLLLGSTRNKKQGRASKVALSQRPVAGGKLGLAFSGFDDSCTIRFESNGRYLDVKDNTPTEGLELQSQDRARSNAQNWKLRRTDKDGEFIVIFGMDRTVDYTLSDTWPPSSYPMPSYMALTYDLSTRRVTLSRYNYSERRPEQTWILERIE